MHVLVVSAMLAALPVQIFAAGVFELRMKMGSAQSQVCYTPPCGD
jgi:hypothetical protein